MAKKKTGKKTSRKPKKNRPGKKWPGWLPPLAIAIFLLITLIAAGYFILLLPSDIKPSDNLSAKEPPLTSLKTKSKAKPVPRIEEIRPENRKKELNLQTEARPAHQPEARLAIIIDDMGEQHPVGRALLDLDLPLSFAFLPYASHTRDLLESAGRKDRDILLHLPMEPRDSRWNPGKGALYTSMSPTRIEITTAADLAAVPGAIGVNNHMGSLFTSDPEAMKPCLSYIRQKGLFFVDSLTNNDSVAWRLARESGLKTARRDIFLDNQRDVEEIKKNILSLIEIAERHGQGIGIGHPHQETLEALRQSREILNRRVKVVGVHELVE